MSEPLRIDNTFCEDFRRCFKRGDYRHNHGYTTQYTASPLSFGGAIHAGLAHFYQGNGKEDACAVALKGWRVISEEVNEDEWRTPAKALEVLDQYFSLPAAELPVLSGVNGQPLVEIDAVYPLLTVSDPQRIRDKLAACGYSDVLYVGLIDLMITWMGKPAICDHKTTSGIYTPKTEPSNIRPQFWDGFRPNKQMIGYLWTVSQYMKEPITTVVINALGVSKANNRNCFERRDFLFTPSEVEEWRRDTVSLVEQYLDCKLNGYWPTNGAPYYCHSYGGHCPYVELCSRPPELRAEFTHLYKVDFWNPLEARKKEAANLS